MCYCACACVSACVCLPVYALVSVCIHVCARTGSCCLIMVLNRSQISSVHLCVSAGWADQKWCFHFPLHLVCTGPAMKTSSSSSAMIPCESPTWWWGPQLCFGPSSPWLKERPPHQPVTSNLLNRCTQKAHNMLIQPLEGEQFP